MFYSGLGRVVARPVLLYAHSLCSCVTKKPPSAEGGSWFQVMQDLPQPQRELRGCSSGLALCERKIHKLKLCIS